MKADLHLHSDASDGRTSPEAVVATAARSGLDLIALTDHDAVAGAAGAVAAGEDHGVRVIPGIEVSSDHAGEEFHILGYGVDPRGAAMLQLQAAAARRRRERMEAMVERLNQADVPVTMEQVLEAAGPRNVALSRSHLARVLSEQGHIRRFGDAFDRFLSSGGAAYVPTTLPPVRETVEAIHAAGGVAVWAHPPIRAFGAYIRLFAEWGMNGVECYRPRNSPAQSAQLAATSVRLDLVPTGGSDWHGHPRQELGRFYLAGQRLERFLEMVG